MRLLGAIFDMDGVLLDSNYIWRDLGSRYLRSQGKEPEAFSRFRKRAQRSGAFAKRRSKGAGTVFAPKRKQRHADFAAT